MERVDTERSSERGKVLAQYAEDAMKIGVRIDLQPSDCVERGIGPDQIPEASGRRVEGLGSRGRIFLRDPRRDPLRCADPAGDPLPCIPKLMALRAGSCRLAGVICAA